MIESVITTPIVLPTTSTQIAFTTDSIKTRSASCCGWLSHNEGTPNYKIIQGGLYEIDFTGNFSSATAGIIAVGLYRDGILDPSTVVSQTIATAGDNTELSISKIIKVCCNANETITIGAVPSVISTPTLVPTDTVEPTVLNANFSIVKKA
jgi:hypothetical protein